MKILVTGGAGYIGSHTIIELLKAGYNDIYSVDSFINSTPKTYDRIEQITNVRIKNHKIDLSREEETRAFFKQNSFDVVIHFAALKSVPESVENPILYYKNNLSSLINVLDAMQEQKIENLLFSSSCSVYGNSEILPVTESLPFGNPESPYAHTKQIGENIIKNYCKSNNYFKSISLRYFNPAGAHISGLIGELSSGRPDNLVPIITQAAAGLRDQLTVFGNDYDTRDGSCVRDYIHVSDVADAHVRAIKLFEGMSESTRVINLGTGLGSTVLELINTFEEVTEQKVNYVVGDRREGDPASVFADNQLAKELLNWEAKFSLSDILKTAWTWQELIGKEAL